MTLRRLALLALALVAPPAVARGAIGQCSYEGPKNLVEITASAPALQYTVTKLDMSWFAPTGRSGPELFSLVLRNNDPDNDVFVLVWVQIAAKPDDPALQARCKGVGLQATGFGDGVCAVQNEVSGEPIKINAGQSRVVTSTELFRSSFASPSKDASLAPWNSEFSNLIRDLGHVPDGQIMMKFAPVCSPAGHKAYFGLGPSSASKILIGPTTAVKSSLTGEYPLFRSVSEIKAILPGAPVATILPEIRTSRPTFSFHSDLADRSRFHYPPGQKRFEIRLWKLLPGEDPQGSVSRRPLHTLETDETNLSFPSAWAPLEVGAAYIWRVDARLIGPVTEALSSEVYGFQVASTSVGAGDLTPDQQRLLELLRIVLGPRYDDMMRSLDGKVPDVGSLRIDGRMVTLEDLERLAAEHEARRIHVVGMRLP